MKLGDRLYFNIDREVKIAPVIAALVSRTVLFLIFQFGAMLVFLLTGSQTSQTASAALWPFAAVFSSIVSFILIFVFMKKENRSIFSLYRFDKTSVLKDILIILGSFLVIGPIGFFPNLLLGNLLFGDYQVTAPMMFQPLPYWVALTGLILFPLTVGLTEVPVYYGYVMPRLMKKTRPAAGLILTAFFHALQHCALPFIPDWRFIAWRFGMFLPLAFVLALLIYWRPRLFPYIVIIHVLMDVSAGAMLLAAAAK